MPDRSDDATHSMFDYPDSHGDAEYVGATAGGAPVYYNRGAREWMEGDHAADDDPVWSSRETLPEDREVGDRIRDVHEESGWEHLADWAREHVPGLGDEGDSSGPSGGDGSRTNGEADADR